MGEFRAAKIKRDNLSASKKSKRLGQHSFCDYLRRYYMAKEFEIEKSSFNGYMNILENHLTPTTRYNYQNIVNSHIDPYFGERNFDNLTANDFSRYYKDLVETQNLSAKSVAKHHGLIHAAYEYAIDGNLITKNPSDRAKRPRVIKKEPSSYSLDEYQKLFAAAKESKFFQK